MASVVYKDIDLSFRKHPVSGDFIKKTDVDAVKQSLRNLFMISPLESSFNPTFGIGIKAMLFENLTPPMVGVIQRKIKEQLFQYEPRCIVEDISVVDDDSNGLTITIAFYVVGNSAKQTFNYVIERVR
jgi:phage baseplate assembly protein W